MALTVTSYGCHLHSPLSSPTVEHYAFAIYNRKDMLFYKMTPFGRYSLFQNFEIFIGEFQDRVAHERFVSCSLFVYLMLGDDVSYPRS